MFASKNHMPGEIAAQLLERADAGKRVALHWGRPGNAGRVTRHATILESQEAVRAAGYAEAKWQEIPSGIEFVDVDGEVFASAIVMPAEDRAIGEPAREVLDCLKEECAEVIQAASKITRFGLEMNPWTGIANQADLESELGDVLAFVELAAKYDLVDVGRVRAACERKIAKLIAAGSSGRLRHATARGMR